MSLKEKIKPYILSFGLAFCFLLFGGNVFAYVPEGYGITTTISLQEYGYYTSTFVIPPANFSTSDCGYNPSNNDIIIKGTLRDSNGNDIPGVNSVTQKDYPTSLAISGFTYSVNLSFPSNYSATGNYYLEFYGISYSTYVRCSPPTGYAYIPFHVDKAANTITLISLSVDGTCGTANGITPTTIPIPENEACSSGTLNNMHDYTTYEGIVYSWSCLGSGEGTSTTCSSLPLSDPVNGACGTANGQTLSSEPSEENKCSSGATNQSTYTTLNGWTWFCYGLFGGTNVACSATNSGAETPPTTPDTADIPTPTDCDTFTGIDKIVCNFGNTIQGLFLPSSEKLVELQTTMAKVNNVFPFNYLQSIGTAFSNTEITSGTLTMTILNNTDSLDSDFFDMPLFENFKLFMTIMVVLMFTFWAVNYIKHFFK